MTDRAQHRLVLCLLAVPVGLAVIGTWLSVRVAAAEVPAGLDPESSPSFVWAVLTFSVVGALVAARRPHSPLGWLLIAIGLLWQLSQVAGDVAAYSTATPGALWGSTVAAWVYEVLWIPAVAALPLLVLLFPDGRLPSPRWWPAPSALAVGTAMLFAAVGLRPGPLAGRGVDNPVGLAFLAPHADLLAAVGNPLIIGASFASLGSLLSRYRRAGAAMRDQLKWLLLAMAAVVAGYSTANVLEAAGADAGLLGVVRAAPILLVPVAVGIAVLRHHLLDIDLVISRVVVYGTLAIGVLVLYVAVVVGVGGLVGPGTADGSSLLLAVVATALAAVVFDPARRGLQRLVDRAVFGQRASPYEALASMTRRVGAGYEDAALLDRMARTIAEATGGRSEVWVAAGNEMELAASFPPGASAVGGGDDVGPDGRVAATFAVRHGDEVLGALTVVKSPGDGFRPAEQRLLSDLADSAGVVLQNARLVADLRSSRERLVAAQDDQRRRVEQDLHDGAQQRLLELALTLRRADRQLAQGSADVVRTLGDAHAQLQQALSELRDLARGIHPAILSEQGLTAALSSLAERSAVSVDLDLEICGRLAPTIESTAYFLTSEALANVAKHAPGSSARVMARRANGALRVEVTDDGPGGADTGGHGLQGLADRVAAVGGRFGVGPADSAGGTTIWAELPCV